MGLARFYLPELVDGNYEFSAEEARHIAGAKRLRVGDKIEVFDGKGHYSVVTIIELKSRKVLVDKRAEIVTEDRAIPRVEIAVAVPKGKRLQYMIEKLSELGVSRVVPVIYDRSVAGGDDPVDKYTRWAVEACKQSRNSWVPEFSNPVKLVDYLGSKKCKLLMADYTGRSILEVLADSDRSEDCSCLVGPEGGFSDEEFDLIEGLGVDKVRLAGNILRIETAAVAFASAIMAISS